MLILRVRPRPACPPASKTPLVGAQRSRARGARRSNPRTRWSLYTQHRYLLCPPAQFRRVAERHPGALPTASLSAALLYSEMLWEAAFDRARSRANPPSARMGGSLATLTSRGTTTSDEIRDALVNFQARAEDWSPSTASTRTYPGSGTAIRTSGGAPGSLSPAGRYLTQVVRLSICDHTASLPPPQGAARRGLRPGPLHLNVARPTCRRSR